VTRGEIEALLEQYRAAVDAQLALLAQLEIVAARQREETDARNFERLAVASDERDRLTRSLVTIEQGLTDVRRQLAAAKQEVLAMPAFAEVVERRRRAAELVAGILDTDRESLKTLADAEIARRAALAHLERGGTTLAAYRKVLTPPASNAALVDRRG
jgi:hypothetical protein